jgi:hypothetical protein
VIAAGQGQRLAIGSGGGLEEHGRLTFERHRLAQAQQAGGGVEAAAEAGGRWAAGAARQHVEHLGHMGLVGETPGSLVGAPRACSTAQAMRHGSRAARSPPGRAAGRDAPGAEFGPVHLQQLAAPGHAVGAEADPVGGEAEHRAVETMLGAHGGDVGVVMLDGDRRHPRRAAISSAARVE